MGAHRISYSFILAYVAVFALILWAFYVIPSTIVEALTAETAAGFLALFGHSVSWGVDDGLTTLVLRGEHIVSVSIIRECTALNVLGVMAGLILPLRASWVKRAAGVALSGFLLFTLNIPRIALTVYLAAYDTWPFTLIAGRSLETYHYPISFAFGVIGVSLTVIAVSRWTTPELANTLINIFEKITAFKK